MENQRSTLKYSKIHDPYLGRDLNIHVHNSPIHIVAQFLYMGYPGINLLLPKISSEICICLFH